MNNARRGLDQTEKEIRWIIARIKREAAAIKAEYEPEKSENSRQDLLMRSQYGAWPFDNWRSHD